MIRDDNGMYIGEGRSTPIIKPAVKEIIKTGQDLGMKDSLCLILLILMAIGFFIVPACLSMMPF